MRKVFSSNEVSETALVNDALVQAGIKTTIQNEQSGRTAVPGFRPPAEIWLVDDGDYEQARGIVVSTIATLDNETEGEPWVCSRCGEENPPSFETCWSCGMDRGESHMKGSSE
jgi:hypothetical protein